MQAAILAAMGTDEENAAHRQTVFANYLENARRARAERLANPTTPARAPTIHLTQPTP